MIEDELSPRSLALIQLLSSIIVDVIYIAMTSSIIVFPVIIHLHLIYISLMVISVVSHMIIPVVPHLVVS